MTAKLAQLVEHRRVELRRLDKHRPLQKDAYATLVKVNFVAVLERLFYKLKGAA